MEKSTWLTFLIVILVVAISYYAITKNGHIIENEFVDCLSEKTTLYVATGCFACQKQEDLFGEDFENLNVVDCAKQENYEKCFVTEQIQYTPTWVINYEQYVGYKSFEELSELTACELKQPEQNLSKNE